MERTARPDGPAHPDVTVQLSGEDGNAYHIISRVSAALRQAGHREAAAEFTKAATRSESHNALLQLAMRTVDVH